MATTPTNKPIPSEDPRDLKFNAGKVDEEVNGSADYYTDRFDVQRLTNTGRNNQFQGQMTQQADDWLEQFNQQNSDFQQFLLNSGYQFLGDYENGPYTITARNQIIRYQNEFWRLNAATNPPYTTTGINSTSWTTDVTHLVSVGDANLRQELASTTGLSLIGAQNGGFLKDIIKIVSYESLGAKFDGINDDTAAIQAGNNLCLNGYTVISSTPNGRARITSQVIFYASTGRVLMGTSYLKPDRSLMTSGYAARVMGDVNKTYSLGCKMEINMIGPYGEVGERPPADTSSISTSLRGLDINPGTTTQVSDVDFFIKVFGFKSNVRIGSKSVYLLRFYGPQVGKAWESNWIFDCQNDAGENISFFGGRGFDAQNSTRTANDIYVTPEGQYLGLFLDNYSQDYNDIDINQNGGHITKSGGQFENNSLSPYAIQRYQSGKRKPALFLTDVNIDGGNDVAQDAGNTGKPVWFDVGGTCIFEAKGGTWGKYAKMQNIKLVSASEGGPIIVKIDGVFFDIASGTDSIEWGAHGNKFRNYDFGLSNLSGWNTQTIYTGPLTPTVPTITFDGSSPVGNSAKLSSVSAGGDTTTLFGQKFNVSPGQIVYASTKMAWNNVSGSNGSAYFGYTFYDAFGNEISHANIGNTVTSGASASVIRSGGVRVPNGAAFVHIGLRHYQLIGDIWLGKVNAFVM